MAAVFVMNQDIGAACDKLRTIGMRGSKKDFIDLYFLFANADGQPMRRMHQEVSWEEIKKQIIKKVKAIKL